MILVQTSPSNHNPVLNESGTSSDQFSLSLSKKAKRPDQTKSLNINLLGNG